MNEPTTRQRPLIRPLRATRAAEISARARRDIFRFLASPPVALFVVVLAALLQAVWTWPPAGFVRVLPDGFLPWAGFVSALLIAMTFALGVRIGIFAPLVLVSAMILPLPFFARFAADELGGWFHWMVAFFFIAVPAFALAVLHGDVRTLNRIAELRKRNLARRDRHVQRR